jgi:hypothetical protein
MKLLIDKGWLIPVDGRRDSIENGAVAIDGARSSPSAPAKRSSRPSRRTKRSTPAARLSCRAL